MQGVRSWLLRCTVVGLVCCGWSGTAVWAETTVCTAITTVPFTITAPGIYCVTQDIGTNLAAGAAIQINTSNVVVDLNGHRLGNVVAGPGNTAIGIRAVDRANLTIKNGTVRGFKFGILLDDSGNSSGHIVEDIRADLNTFTALQIEGTSNIIRNNLILETGGTTTFGPNTNVYGIVVDGVENQILNNTVTNTVAVGTGVAFGIFVESGSAVVDHNRISNAALPGGGGSSHGIFIQSEGTNVLVVDNRITTMTNGIFYDAGSTGKYARNLTSNVPTPYTGGTASVAQPND